MKRLCLNKEISLIWISTRSYKVNESPLLKITVTVTDFFSDPNYQKLVKLAMLYGKRTVGDLRIY